MKGGTVDILIRQKAIDEVTRLRNELSLAVGKIVELNAEGSKLGIKVGSSTEISKLKKEIDALKIALKGVDEVEKSAKQTKSALEKANARLSNIYNKEAQDLLKVRTQTTQIVGEQRKQIKTASALDKTYQKLNQKYQKLNKLAKEAAAKHGENSAQFKKASAKALTLRNRISSINKVLKDGRIDVGRYGLALKGVYRLMTSLAGALSITVGLHSLFRILGEGLKTIRTYGKENATLTAILQVAKVNTRELREESARLGETTVKTATEVVGLQIAYARLGFSQKEIIDLTEATIQGSIAMNSELSQTANIVGAIVNTYDDLSTTDAPKILDILSLATAKSALNFEKLEKGIPIVAGAANAAGISFTKLISLMGKLADSGIDISTSSTALRNIFILSAAEGLNYAEILEKIKGSTDKLTTSNDAFGRRAAVSATVLAQNIDSAEDLDEALQGAAGTAERMANEELDTLDGALKLLKSAWQGVVLETDNANDVSNKLKRNIQFLAKNLKSILRTVGRVTGAFLLYRLGVIATNSVLIKGRLLNKLYRISLIAINGGIKKVITSMKALKIATAASGFGLFLVALASAYTLWQTFKDGAKDATTELEKFNDESQRMSDIQATITDSLKKFTKGQDRYNVASINYEKLLENANRQLERQGLNYQKVNAALQLIQNSRETDIKLLDEQIDQAATFTEEQKKLIKEYIIAGQTFRNQIDINADFIEKKNEEQKKVDEKRNKQRLKDEFNLQKEILKQKIGSSKSIVNDDKASLEERIKANHDFVVNSAKLNDLERDNAVKNAKDRTSEIKRLEIVHQKNIAKISEEQGKNQAKIFTDRFNQVLADVKAEKELKEEAKNSELTDLYNRFQAEIDLFEGSNDAKLKLVEEYEKAKKAIHSKYAKEELKAQVEKINNILDTEKLSSSETFELHKLLTSLKISLNKEEAEDYDENTKKKVAAELKFQNFIAGQIMQASDTINDVLGINAGYLDDFFAKMIEVGTGGIKSLEQGLESLLATTRVVGEIGNIIYNTRIENIDAEIDASNEYYDNELEKLDALSERENETEIEKLARGKREKSIESEKKKAEQKLEAEKRKEQKKQHEFNKKSKIFEINIAMALGIMQAYAQLGPIAGTIAGVIVTALGIAQIAAVENAPIPKYKLGKKKSDNYSGWALVNDGVKAGKPVQEYRENSKGNISAFKGKDILTHVAKDDIIHKDLDALLDYHSDDDFFKQIQNASIRTSLELNRSHLNQRQSEASFQQNLNNERFKQEMIKTMKNIKINNHISEKQLSRAMANAMEDVFSANNFRDGLP